MYEELVKCLRSQCQGYGKECEDCNADGNCRSQMENEAADAIEELQKANCELLFRVGQAEALIDYYQTGRMISNEPPKEE